MSNEMNDKIIEQCQEAFRKIEGWTHNWAYSTYKMLDDYAEGGLDKCIEEAKKILAKEKNRQARVKAWDSWFDRVKIPCGNCDADLKDTLRQKIYVERTEWVTTSMYSDGTIEEYECVDSETNDTTIENEYCSACDASLSHRFRKFMQWLERNSYDYCYEGKAPDFNAMVEYEQDYPIDENGKNMYELLPDYEPLLDLLLTQGIEVEMPHIKNIELEKLKIGFEQLKQKGNVWEK